MTVPLYNLEPSHFYKVLKQMTQLSFENVQKTSSGIQSALEDSPSFRRVAPKGDSLVIKISTSAKKTLYFVESLIPSGEKSGKRQNRHVEAFRYYYFTHIKLIIDADPQLSFLDSLLTSLTTNRITCKYLSVFELTQQSVDYTDLCISLSAEHFRFRFTGTLSSIPLRPLSSISVHLTIDLPHLEAALENTIGKFKNIYIKLSRPHFRTGFGVADVENAMASALNMLQSTATRENFSHFRLVYSAECGAYLPSDRILSMLKKTNAITAHVNETTYWRYNHSVPVASLWDCEKEDLYQGQQTEMDLFTRNIELVGVIEIDEGLREYSMEMNVGNRKLRNAAMKYWDFTEK